MKLNIYGYILLILQVLEIIVSLISQGKDKGKYNLASVIGSIIGLIIILLALGIKISISL